MILEEEVGVKDCEYLEITDVSGFGSDIFDHPT